MKALRRFLKGVGLGLAGFVAFLAVIQLVPYGRAHSNPPVVAEPAWNSPRTRELVARACFDCHSNETKWPWYSHVAPFSWVMERDVKAGRRTINFSEWTQPHTLVHEAGGAVMRSEMPPRSYLALHDHAQLTNDERVELARGLHATFGLPWRD
jgi:hypothetical protein